MFWVQIYRRVRRWEGQQFSFNMLLPSPTLQNECIRPEGEVPWEQMETLLENILRAAECYFTKAKTHDKALCLFRIQKERKIMALLIESIWWFSNSKATTPVGREPKHLHSKYAKQKVLFLPHLPTPPGQNPSLRSARCAAIQSTFFQVKTAFHSILYHMYIYSI